MRNSLSVSALTAGLLLFAGAPPLRSQGPASTFQDRVDVRVVNVEVYVTDKKGRPVEDLTRDDFELFDDGEPVEISNFYEVAGGQVRVPAPSDSRQAAGALPAAPTVATGGEPLTLIVFIDNTTLLMPHRNRVLDEVRGFVAAQSGPDRRFLLVTFDPGLRLHTALTSDVGEVIEALDEVATMPAGGLQAVRDRQKTIRQIQDVYELWEQMKGPGPRETVGEGSPGETPRYDPCENGWAHMTTAVDTYAEAVQQRVGAAQAALLRLTRSVGGLPGRKNVLYLSDGLEQIPGIDLFDYLGEVCPRREREMFSYWTRFDSSRLFEELTAYANAHRLTFYALDTAGLRGPSIASVEYDRRRFAPSGRNDHLRTANLQNSLFVMADETGGRAFFNANQPAAELATIGRDLDHHYSLGFAPARGWDGRRHSIRLQLKEGRGKGLDLRYRRRYQAVPEDERKAERTLATLVLGLEDNPLGAEIALGREIALESGTFEVPLRITLPAGRLTLLPDGEARKGLVRILIMAEDDRGRQTSMREKVVPLRLPAPETHPDARHLVVVEMELEAGLHTLGIGIEDQIGGVASFLRASVDAGAGPGRGDG